MLCIKALFAALVCSTAGAAPIHHFVFFGGDRDAIKTDSLFLNTKSIEGAQILYTWRFLERGKDGYDFSEVRQNLEFLKSHGKKLWIQLQDVSFNESRSNVPEYLLKDTTYHGGAERTYRVRGDNDSSVQMSGWVARRWDPAVQERFAKLLMALGKEFDGEIAGINLPETALEYGSTGKLFPPGFTHESYRAAIKTNLAALKKAFPKSVAMQYANFVPGEWRPDEDKGYLTEVYNFAKSIGVGVGGPDLMPSRPGQMGSSYPLLRDAAGIVPTGLAVQDDNLAEINPKTGKRVTAAELLEFAQTYLKLDYIFWGNQEPYYSSDIIPTLRSQAKAASH
jgi:hypothetical protein